MATVRFEEAQRWYPGADRPAVPGISLDIADGEFMVLVGPSGCGKSTTLRMLAGLEEVNKGKIFIGDRDITTVPPKDRDIAMGLQNYGLYPHMSVSDNMGVQTRTDIAKLQADLGVTTVYVTHDQVEAMTMGDRVAVMKDGYLQQVDTPLGLYDRPVNLFVAGFIGSPAMNLLEAQAKDGKAQIGDYVVPVDPAASAKMH